VASEASDERVADGEPRTGQREQLCVDIGRHVVDALDHAPTLTAESSRQLLVRKTERLLGRRLQVPDSPYRRQWFIGLVDACMEHPTGLRALVAALDVLDPGSVTARSVARMVGCWQPAARTVPGLDGVMESGGSAGTATPAAVSKGPARRPSDEPDDALTERERAALASAFPSAIAQRQFLESAGLAVELQPNPVGLTPRDFWNEVNRLLTNGVLEHGRERILAEAARRLPGNRVIADGILQ
jgi:Effector-associated domain 2/Effector-associated domain 1